MEIPIDLKEGKKSVVYDNTIFRKKYAKLNYIVSNLSVTIMIVVAILCYIMENVNLLAIIIMSLCMYYCILSKHFIKEKENFVSCYTLTYDENDKKIIEVMYINVKDSCLEVYRLNSLSKIICNKKEIILQGNISVTKDYIVESQIETSENIVNTVTIPRVFTSEVEEMFRVTILKGGEKNGQEYV